MNAYQKAQSLALTGTDAEIVAKLQTITVSDIQIESVQSWFREKDLWMRGPEPKRLGSLEVVYSNASTPAQAIAGLDYLWATVFGGTAQTLRTTDPEWSVKVKSLVDLVVALSPSASGLVDSFYALDGGRPFKDLTVSEFAAQRTAAIAAESAQAIREAVWTVMDRFRNQIGTSEQAAGITSMRAMLDGLED
jgi:hypothetical protein